MGELRETGFPIFLTSSLCVIGASMMMERVIHEKSVAMKHQETHLNKNRDTYAYRASQYLEHNIQPGEHNEKKRKSNKHSTIRYTIVKSVGVT